MQGLVAIFAVALLVFVGALVGTSVGALVGWIVGLVFTDTMHLMADMLGVDASPYQLGAMLGFAGSFFRPTTTKSE